MKPHKHHYWSLTLLMILGVVPFLNAQVPIQALTASYKTTSTGILAFAATPAPSSGSFNHCAEQLFNYTFNNGADNALLLTGIIANEQSFFMPDPTPSVIKLRRVDNAVVSGTRHITFLEATAATASSCSPGPQYRFKSAYTDDMEAFLNNNYINQGTDNLFTNAGNGDANNNNIERVDVIFPYGIIMGEPEKGGFTLLERGDNNAHDPFRIAAITAIDINGDPTAFGPVRTCLGGNGSSNGNWGHPSLEQGNRNLAVYVLRKEEGEEHLRAAAASNQQLGGVFFSLADLGVTANQVIYGYALLSADGIPAPTSKQLLDLSDQAVYPRNTNESSGGLDLIAVNAFFQARSVLKDQAIHLKGGWQGDKALLQWTLKEVPVSSIAQVQRSNNGSDYTTLHSFIVPSTFYKGVFEDALEGYAFYRLKIETPDKQVAYSSIVQVKGTFQTLQLIPSRIQPSQSVRVRGVQDGMYTVLLTSSLGVTYVASLKVQSGTGLIESPVGGFSKGFYYVSIKGIGNIEGGSKLVVY